MGRPKLELSVMDLHVISEALQLARHDNVKHKLFSDDTHHRLLKKMLNYTNNIGVQVKVSKKVDTDAES